MNKQIKYGVCALLLIVIVLLLIDIETASAEEMLPQLEEVTVEQPINTVTVIQDKVAEQAAIKKLNKYKKKKIRYITKEFKKYSDYMTSSQKAKVKKYKKNISKATLKVKIQKNIKKVKVIIKKAKQFKKRFWNSGPTNFQSCGIKYYNGHRFTYYSSRVLYHYRTSEWTPDNLGFYRDSQGYLVVAADFISQGSLISTPWGMGKKYDCGAGSNTVDMYVNW